MSDPVTATLLLFAFGGFAVGVLFCGVYSLLDQVLGTNRVLKHLAVARERGELEGK